MVAVYTAKHTRWNHVGGPGASPQARSLPRCNPWRGLSPNLTFVQARCVDLFSRFLGRSVSRGSLRLILPSGYEFHFGSATKQYPWAGTMRIPKPRNPLHSGVFEGGRIVIIQYQTVLMPEQRKPCVLRIFPVGTLSGTSLVPTRELGYGVRCPRCGGPRADRQGHGHGPWRGVHPTLAAHAILTKLKAVGAGYPPLAINFDTFFGVQAVSSIKWITELL